MRYKLLGDNNTSNIIETVLNNRGIYNCKRYIAIDSADKEAYLRLNNIHKAVDLFVKHFEAKNPIAILQDTDTDGITSAAIIYRMIKNMDADYSVSMIVHHKNKAHGLESKDIDIPPETKLLIIPDAASNDVAEHIELHKQGIDILILDHHHISADISDSPAVIVNNQISSYYGNPDCSGAAIALEFCRAIDNYYWENNAERLIDLCALGNVADDMNLGNMETKAMVTEGLLHVNNKMFQAILTAQEYSTKGEVNPFTVSWYVAPLINAFLRLATYEERQLLIKAFCEEDNETFEYTKRGEVFPIEENIYEHCVRLMKSYKSKQDRVRNKAIEVLSADLSQYDNNKVAIIDVTDILDSAYTGLVAIRLSDMMHKPVLLGRFHNGELSGSGRAFDNCPIEDFRALTAECPYSTLAEGHPSAYGMSLQFDKIDKANEWFNDKLKDVDMNKLYLVDFILDTNEINEQFIYTIYQHRNLWGSGVKTPRVAIQNIKLTTDDIQILGKNLDTIKFAINDIEFVQFRCQSGNVLYDYVNSWEETEGEININAIVECGVNTFNGVCKPQCVIVDVERCDKCEQI